MNTEHSDIDARSNALRRLTGEPEFQLKADKKVDNRRDKEYCRVVEVSWYMHAQHDDSIPGGAHQLFPSVDRVLDLSMDAIKASGGSITPPARIRVGQRVQHQQPYRSDDETRSYYYAVKLCVDAKRPSQIVPESYALHWARRVVLPALTTAIRLAHMQVQERLRQAKASREAERIAESVSQRIMERARAAVRYDQRLAALKAELEAELAVQSESFRRSDELQEALRSSDEQFEPEAVQYALDHFHERFVAWDSAFRHVPRWSAEDLFPSTEREDEATS